MLIFGFIMLFWFIFAVSSPTPVRAVSYTFIFFLLIILTLTKGCYISLVETHVTNVQGFFPKKIDINRISHISIQQSYKGTKSIKSLYIFFVNSKGDTKYSHVSLGLYKPTTLKELINDLKQLNPKIEIDEDVHKLIGKAK
jgi:hypothetical protein